MIVIVTGCNGRLGGAVSDLLLASGHIVIGIDAQARPDRPHRVLIENLCDPFAIHRAFDAAGDDVDAIIHLANHTNTRTTAPAVVLRDNLAMNSSVFMAALDHRVRRLVFASSIQAMLGGSEADGSWSQRPPVRLPIDETIECRPTNGYGLSKLLSERMLTELCAAGRFSGPPTETEQPRAHPSAISLRLPFIQTDEAFDHMVSRSDTPQAEFRWGGAEAFAYITRSDAANTVLCALEATSPGHEVLWCSAPDPRTGESVPELARRFYAQVPGVQAAIERDSFVDCTLAQRLIGWIPTRILREQRSQREIG